MNYLFFLLAGVVTMGALCSSSTDCDEKLLLQLVHVVKAVSIDLLKYEFEKDPKTSHAVSSFPLICILAHLASHSHGSNYRKLLELFDAENTDEIKNMFAVAQRIIKEMDKSEELVGLQVFANKSISYTQTFKRDFAQYCCGLAKTIDFNRSPARHVNNWFKKQQRDLQGIGAKQSMFKNNGLVYAAFTYSRINLNNINNPSGQRIMNFYVNKKIIKRMGLYGNAYMKYAEIKELDAKMVQLGLHSEKSYVLVVLPNRPEGMASLIKDMANVTVFNKALAAMKPMCIKFRAVIGAAHMVDNIVPYIRHRGISLNGYHNVSKNNNCDTRINSIIQEINFTASPIEERGSIHSPKCPRVNKSMPVFNANRPVVYHLMCEAGAPVISGIFSGNEYGGNLARRPFSS